MIRKLLMICCFMGSGLLHAQITDDTVYPVIGQDKDSKKKKGTKSEDQASILDRSEFGLEENQLDKSIKGLLKDHVYLIQSDYYKSDKEGNRYINEDRMNLKFKALGINLEGVLVTDPSSIQPWKYDTSYVAIKDLKPVLGKVSYQKFGEKQVPRDVKLKSVSNGIGAVKLDSKTGISGAVVKGKTSDNLYILSYGFIDGKMVSYLDGFNELSAKDNVEVPQFFNEFLGAVYIETKIESSGIKVNAVGFINEAPTDSKRLTQTTRFSSSDLKAFESVTKEGKKSEKKKLDEKKKNKKKGFFKRWKERRQKKKSEKASLK